MSTTLFFLVPIGMLAVVWSLCFVGSCFPTSGLPGPPYSNVILQETTIVAYWPLSDLAGQTPIPPPQNSTGVGTALDLTGNGHNGSYLEPPAYPSAAAFPLSMSFANPTLKLRQPSIVNGDAFQPGSKNLPACVDFEGGYVSIPWASNSPSLAQFTLEAWVHMKWSAPGNRWVVFGAITATTGFVLYVNENNNWEIAIGDGMQNNLFDTMIPAPVMPSATTTSATTYVALTFGPDNFLRLWINPDSDTSAPPTATWTSPNPVVYAPVGPTQSVTFFIGAGYNDQPVRTQGGVVDAPLYPYQGLIQSVALYQSALGATDLASHFGTGAAS